MKKNSATQKSEFLSDLPDFSLVLGGPLYQLFRRSHLVGDSLELLSRRLFIISGFAWLPLLLLSVFGGSVLGDGVKVPFLHDIEVHVRFLVALPVLIAAELIIHLRLRPVVRQFVERNIVVPEEISKFRAAIESVMRVRNSKAVEIALIVLVYTVGLWLWKNQTAISSASWYASPDGTNMNLTVAGYWYAFVSLPLFQFILLRWYLRIGLWFTFLWKVSRLNLRLIPTHPDRAGGLGFLGQSTYAFGPILFAQGAMLAGLIASQIFYGGQNLLAFKLPIVGFLAFIVALVFTPLTVFTAHLTGARRKGLAEYGKLASGYVREFEEKWIRGGASKDEALLGSGDIQSLADLGNSFGVIQEMRFVPFGWKDVTRLAAAAATPLLPLSLTIFSLAEVVEHLLKVMF